MCSWWTLIICHLFLHRVLANDNANKHRQFTSMKERTRHFRPSHGEALHLWLCVRITCMNLSCTNSSHCCPAFVQIQPLNFLDAVCASTRHVGMKKMGGRRGDVTKNEWRVKGKTFPFCFATHDYPIFTFNKKDMALFAGLDHIQTTTSSTFLPLARQVHGSSPNCPC